MSEPWDTVENLCVYLRYEIYRPIRNCMRFYAENRGKNLKTWYPQWLSMKEEAKKLRDAKLEEYTRKCLL